MSVYVKKIVFYMILTALTTACGMKGALYLPAPSKTPPQHQE